MIAPETTNCQEGLSVLIFSSEGVKMAVGTEQIVGITDLEQAIEIQTQLMNVYGTPFTHEGGTKNGMVLLVKDDRAASGIVVDRLDEIAFVTIDTIQLIPPLIEATGRLKIIRGAFIKNDEMIFLADLTLLENKQHPEVNNAPVT